MYGYTLLDCIVESPARVLKLQAVSEAIIMPIENTFYEALHPIQRVLKLYEQWE